MQKRCWLILLTGPENCKAPALSAAFNNFLHKEFKEEEIENHLDDFCMIDDYDVLSAIKSWTLHPDKILSVLCKGIINRRLLKSKIFWNYN